MRGVKNRVISEGPVFPAPHLHLKGAPGQDRPICIGLICISGFTSGSSARHSRPLSSRLALRGSGRSALPARGRARARAALGARAGRGPASARGECPRPSVGGEGGRAPAREARAAGAGRPASDTRRHQQPEEAAVVRLASGCGQVHLVEPVGDDDAFPPRALLDAAATRAIWIWRVSSHRDRRVPYRHPCRTAW